MASKKPASPSPSRTWTELLALRAEIKEIHEELRHVDGRVDVIAEGMTDMVGVLREIRNALREMADHERRIAALERRTG